MSSALTPHQTLKVREIYEMLARLLPTAGREYSITIDFDREDGRPHIKMIGLTPFGRLWVKYCMEVMERSHGINKDTVEKLSII